MPEICIRLAKFEDIPALRMLIESSVRTLQAGDYSPDQIAGALGTVLGVDTQLIQDETYYVAETTSGTLAGCGGWSKRKTLFGSDQATVRQADLLDPATEAARIRAFFVHPDFARQGVGSRILEACESAALAAGFRRFELGATITGEKLYRVRGYAETDRIEVPLANGTTLPVIRMTKSTQAR